MSILNKYHFLYYPFSSSYIFYEYHLVHYISNYIPVKQQTVTMKTISKKGRKNCLTNELSKNNLLEVQL